MGIYIPNIEMPTKGYKLILVHADGTVQTTDGETTGIPVPSHGRLIDADALIKPKNQHIDVLADEWYVTVRTIETAPTILQAEEEAK